MGYSISQDQYERLERNKAEGRLCCCSTGRGGCFNRATIRAYQQTWVYTEDRQAGKPPTENVAVYCGRHGKPSAGWLEGLNYTTIRTERF